MNEACLATATDLLTDSHHRRAVLMSDHFQMLVDADVTVDDAGSVTDAVICELRRHGLIKGQLTDDDGFGPEGYLPGPAVPNLYKQGKEKYQFWKVRPRVVETRIGRSF